MPPKARGGARGRGRPPRRGASSTRSASDAQDVQMQDSSETISGNDSEPLSSQPAISAPGASNSTDTEMADRSVEIKAEPTESAMAPPAPPSTVRRTPSVRGAKRGLLAQPKFAGRRSKAEREAAEASQAARRVEEAKAKTHARERNDGARGGRGGSRGGFMGDFRRRESAGATGVFGAGVVSSEFSGRRSSARGYGGGGGGGGGGGTGQPTGSTKRRVKVEGTDGDANGPTYIDISSSDSDEEAEEGPKRNIDYIDLRSDEEDNQNGHATSSATTSRGMQPVRVQRVEHKDRHQPSAAKSSKVDRKRAMKHLERASLDGSSKGKQRATDTEPAQPPEHEWKGVYQDDEDEDDVKPENSSSAQAPTPSETTRRRPRKSSGPDLQTEEEREEHQRHLLDLDTIVHELGQTNVSDPDGEVPMAATPADGTAPKDDPRAYKVYLFQFPPILPQLQTEAAQATGKKSASSSPTLARAVPAVKTEPDEKPAPPVAPVSGRVGKLRVHESGKVSLDWAGTSLAVGMGTEVEFLQQVVMARTFDGERVERHVVAGKGEPEPSAEEREAKSDVKQPPGYAGGEAMALGQVRGKFVVTPNWDEII